MAINGLSSKVTDVYICKDDPSRSVEDGATGFYPGRVPNLIITRIKDQIQTASMSYGDMQTQTFQQRNSMKNRECFRFGLGAGRPWDNFFTPEGEEIPFETQMHMEGGNTYSIITERVMDMIHSNTIDEVGGEIWNRNTMTDTQRKNFEELSSRLGALSTSNAASVTTVTDENEDATDQPSDPMAGMEIETDDDPLPPGSAILAEPKPGRKVSATEVIGTGKTRPRRSGKTGAPGG